MILKFEDQVYNYGSLFHQQKRFRPKHHDAQCMYQSSKCTVFDFVEKMISQLRICSFQNNQVLH